MNLKNRAFPEGRPLFIGSMPLRDHREALKTVLDRAPLTPNWVQLPANQPEGFLIQFCEGLPGLQTEPKVRIETQSERFEADLLSFYEDYLACTEGGAPLEGSRFTVSRKAAPGLHLFAESLSELDSVLVKGQMSGPLSILLGVLDDVGRCSYYDDRARDAVVKLLALKVKWQAALLQKHGHEALIFVDEPAMGGLGSSAYIGIAQEEALALVGEVLGAIKESGAWAGVHVCANADWGAILSVGLNVLSFDAYSYFERVALFRKEIIGFLEQGGMLAWGIVPTGSEALKEVTAQDLATLWKNHAEDVGGGSPSIRDILQRSFITPSCGLASVDDVLALRAADLTSEVSRLLRKQVRISSGR